MPERTYTGFAPRGEVQPVDRKIRFKRDEPVEVTDDEAAVLDQNPEWGGTPTDDDLTGLDRPALRKVAEAEGVEFTARWGVERLTETIRAHRIAQTQQTDPPEEGSNG